LSIPLKLFGNYLLVARLTGTAIILAIAYLTYRVAKTYISSKASLLAVMVWLTVSPTWSWQFSQPALSAGVWPNHLGVLLILGSFSMLMNARESRSAFYAGFLLFLATQCRMEFIFALIFGSLVIYIYKKQLFLKWALGLFTGFCLTAIYLVSIGSIKDWYLQTIKVWTMNPPDVPNISINFFVLMVSISQLFRFCLVPITLTFTYLFRCRFIVQSNMHLVALQLLCCFS